MWKSPSSHPLWIITSKRFYYHNFKTHSKAERIYSDWFYTLHPDSTISNLLYLVYHTSICLSIHSWIHLIFYGNAVLIWRKKNKNKEGEEEWGSEGKKGKVVLRPLGKLESQMQRLNGATRKQGISLALVDFLTFLSQRIFTKEVKENDLPLGKKDITKENLFNGLSNSKFSTIFLLDIYNYLTFLGLSQKQMLIQICFSC